MFSFGGTQKMKEPPSLSPSLSPSRQEEADVLLGSTRKMKKALSLSRVRARA